MKKLTLRKSILSITTGHGVIFFITKKFCSTSSSYDFIFCHNFFSTSSFYDFIYLSQNNKIFSILGYFYQNNYFFSII